MKRNVISIVFAALAFCACSKEGEPIVKESEAPVVYHVSIPASMTPGTKGVIFDGDGVSISTKFEVGDKVYIYNKTKDALARHWDDEEDCYLATPIVLTSAMIQNEGQSCTLVGDLSFVKWDDNKKKSESVTPEEGDEYCLYYQLNDADYSMASTNYYPRFDYSVQDGSATTASECDFAIVDDVVLTLSGSTLTVPDNVRFMNLQSMFRQKLTFTNSASETVTPTIKLISVGTENGTLICYHNPTIDISSVSPDKYETYYSIDIENPVISDENIYLALAFYYPDEESKSDKLILTASDTEGNVYRCTKNVPAGGFQNGKYYFGNCTMEWDHQIIMPTVERSDGGDLDELTPYGDYYDIDSGTSGEIAISISGSSNGFYFWLNSDPATVTLTGNGTAVYPDNNPFIYGDRGDLTIILDSDYTIVCPNHAGAIWAEFGNLKLRTNGSSQILTVTANSAGYRGLYGFNNYSKEETIDGKAAKDAEVSSLADKDFTVTCSDRIDNPDGTYTWVYTVTPNS